MWYDAIASRLADRQCLVPGGKALLCACVTMLEYFQPRFVDIMTVLKIYLLTDPYFVIYWNHQIKGIKGTFIRIISWTVFAVDMLFLHIYRTMKTFFVWVKMVIFFRAIALSTKMSFFTNDKKGKKKIYNLYCWYISEILNYF